MLTRVAANHYGACSKTSSPSGSTAIQERKSPAGEGGASDRDMRLVGYDPDRKALVLLAPMSRLSGE